MRLMRVFLMFKLIKLSPSLCLTHTSNPKRSLKKLACHQSGHRPILLALVNNNFILGWFYTAGLKATFSFRGYL